MDLKWRCRGGVPHDGRHVAATPQGRKCESLTEQVRDSELPDSEHLGERGWGEAYRWVEERGSLEKEESGMGGYG